MKKTWNVGINSFEPGMREVYSATKFDKLEITIAILKAFMESGPGDDIEYYTEDSNGWEILSMYTNKNGKLMQCVCRGNKVYYKEAGL